MFEQLLADDVLQPAKLSADGRLRKPQLAAGANDAAISRDLPEIEEVLVIENFHGTILRYIGTKSRRDSVIDVNYLRRLESDTITNTDIYTAPSVTGHRRNVVSEVRAHVDRTERDAS